jgi:hypothetical protein
MCLTQFLGLLTPGMLSNGGGGRRGGESYPRRETVQWDAVVGVAAASPAMPQASGLAPSQTPVEAIHGRARAC